MGLMVLFFRIFLVGHYWACFWFYLTTPAVTLQPIPTEEAYLAGEPFHARTWVSEFGFQYQDNASQYVSALYFAFATLLTVGESESLTSSLQHPPSNIDPLNMPLTCPSLPNTILTPPDHFPNTSRC